MKTLVFEKHTKDVDGLLTELRREIGPVISVATDPHKTYVYVEDDSPLDPTPTVNQWEDVPEIRVESMNQVGPDGVPVAWADGKDLHTLIIQKTTGFGDVLPDSTKVVITTASKVPLSRRKLRLKDGLASITFGPTVTPEAMTLTVVDSWKKMQPVAVRVQFVPPPPDAEVEPVPEPEAVEAEPNSDTESPPEAAPTQKESKASVWQRLRKILGF
jgi:hypothetical protein